MAQVNLEVHYKPTVMVERLSEFSESLKSAFNILGKACQESIIMAYNAVDKLSPISSDRVIVRFAPVDEYDIGAPDICFVIKCGGRNFSLHDQRRVCESFERELWFYLEFEGRTDSFDIDDFDIDFEIYCLPSHGFCRRDGQIVDSW